MQEKVETIIDQISKEKEGDKISSSQTVDKVLVFAGTFPMSTVFLI